ncbi:hypothetical protein ABH897_005584 [Paenibacillus sp. RC73]|uniref:hypothetical protein n=1 Tax=Paenibacillus sp. RC73 TaxID=3156250 RepID=UPI003834A12E
MRSIKELEAEWCVSGVDHVGSRMVYFFSNREEGDDLVLRVSVSRTFADPAAQAWRKLGETVK